MNDAQKTNNFLNAIKKYADQQKQDLQEEIEQFRVQEMKKAEEEGLKAAYELIQHELADKRSAITRDLAKQEKESQDSIFLKRCKMMDTVFKKATDSLQSYTQTPAYKEKLLQQAKEISGLFGSKNCVLCLKNSDLKYADMLKENFSGNVTVTSSPDIQIGGIKGYCAEMNIVADNTLDSKLTQQKEWFIEHSGLTVM